MVVKQLPGRTSLGVHGDGAQENECGESERSQAIDDSSVSASVGGEEGRRKGDVDTLECDAPEEREGGERYNAREL